MELKNSNEQIFKYHGVIHVHSIYSDGTGDIYKIAKAAKKAKLDFIIVTDHNNMNIQEGIIEGVTVIKGEEISPVNGNHYLTLGLDECILPQDNLENTIIKVRESGGFGFAAHPDESERRKNIHRPIKWLDKNMIPDGIEIWNWFSLWADNYDDRNIFTKMYSYFLRNRLVTKPHRITLDWWDRLNKKTNNIIPVIGGVDAHALKIKSYIIPLTIFPYKEMFNTVVNEILLKIPLEKSFQQQKKQILKALKEGHNIIFNKKIYREAPEFYIKNSLTTAYSGDTIAIDSATFLHFKSKKKVIVKVYRDSDKILESNSKQDKICIKEIGKYRLEFEDNEYSYAYSNVIKVINPIFIN